MITAFHGIAASAQIVAGGPAPTTYSDNASLMSGLFAYYRMAGTTDETGTYTLTINGATTVTGLQGNCQSFTTNDYAYASNTMLDTKSNLTIANWVYLDSLPASGGLYSIWEYRGKTFAGAQFDVGTLQLYNNGGTQQVFVRHTCSTGSSTVQPEVLVNYTFTTGAWHSVVSTFNGTTLELWIDGVSQGTSTVASSAISQHNAFSLTFGKRCLNNTRYLEGDLDEMAFTSTAWGSSEVAAFHNAGVGLPYA